MKTITTLSLTLLIAGSALSQTPVKKVFLEEFTTTLCGNCPPKSYDVHQWYEQNKQRAVLMVHHAGFGTDQMTNTEASTFASYFQPSTFGFAPAIMIDRDVYPWRDSVPYMSVNGFDSIALRVSNNPAEASVVITGSYNSTTRQLNLTATATFVSAIPSGSKRIQLFLIEDSLIGTGSGWDQKCYSSSWANAHYPGQYNSSTQYITQYPHRRVQRGSLTGGAWGPVGNIPSTPVIGTPYSINATFTVPANYNDARLHIVAFVADYGVNKKNRNIYNSAEVKISDLSSTSTGVNQEQPAAEINAMYPNPASGEVTLNLTLHKESSTSITVQNLAGQQVAILEPGTNLPSGRYEATFPINGLAPGLYMIRMQNGDQIITRKLAVE